MITQNILSDFVEQCASVRKQTDNFNVQFQQFMNSKGVCDSAALADQMTRTESIAKQINDDIDKIHTMYENDIDDRCSFGPHTEEYATWKNTRTKVRWLYKWAEKRRKITREMRAGQLQCLQDCLVTDIKRHI
ncbi:MAG TPA: hypothetical protein VLE95_07610 [Chlamydiales bacterium]|nr:hypothetical protein [Chlamydiales bacterium]